MAGAKEAYYDVFLSFRGPDTRNTFIGHLYKALVDAGINTFKDDHGIERGEKIESELQEAIRDSRISLIVFSENYASSRWCLDELVQILQHKKTNIIIPIFYHVNPSHVRKQKRSYAEAFASHEEKLEEATVERWKAALREVAELGGMVLKKHEDEANFIHDIVEDVRNKLSRTRLSVASYMEEQVKILKKRLRNVESFVNDAENKKYKDESVKEWLDEFRYVVYDAEDVIDEVAMEAQCKKLKLEDQSQTISSSKHKKGKTIKQFKEITQKFEELELDASKLRLQQVDPRSSSSSSTTTFVFREMTSLMDESRVYGRDDDKKKIIDLLLPKELASGGNNLSVIPIVGMGGVGKTTLAQMVYNDNHRLKDHFPLKAWVCVSDEFDVEKVTRTILKYVSPDTCKSDDVLDQLQIKLKIALNGKRFLIVLDDVWDNSKFNWDLLSKAFGEGAAGSAIIVTTRDGKIPSKMRAVHNHYLQPLSEDDCWYVFAQRAFWKISVDASPNLKKIGKEIVRKCKGLPLAAKSLGGLLCSMEEECDWKNVLNDEIWDLTLEESGILPVLKLSYYYLQPHLKRCFAYCSIFPKDYEFKEEKVVLLWMAEGFLEQPEGKMNMEDFGRICFRELLLRSFFQPSSFGRFVMHDLMSDLAQWVAGKTCFRLDDSSDISKISHKARHCSFYGDDDKFEVFNKVDYLRTLLS